MKTGIWQEFDGYRQLIADIEAARKAGETYTAEKISPDAFIKRLHPDRLHWFAGYPRAFLSRFQEDPSEINLMALLGALAGVLAPPEPGGEKDYNTYDRLPGLAEARAFYAACRGADPTQSGPQP